MSEFAPPNPYQRALPPGNRPQLDFPPEILGPLLTARELWSRTGYLVTPRVVEHVGIDEALDDLLAYQQALVDFEKTFGKEMENVG